MNGAGSDKAELPFQSSFFYGWIIVAVSATTLFFSGPGQTYSVSSFIDSYISEFGWSRAVVSSMYSVGTLIAGLLMGFMGSFFDKRGHRFMTTIIAAIRHNRRGVGSETVSKYIDIARDRIEQEMAGTLRTRPMHKPVYDPEEAGNKLTLAPWAAKRDAAQMSLLDDKLKKNQYITK